MKSSSAFRRARRVRARLEGTSSRPRLSVHRSLRHLSVQLIDDASSRTLASASDREIAQKGKPVAVAREVGILIASRAKEKGIMAVLFDRGSYRYHGRVAAVAHGAREGGLAF